MYDEFDEFDELIHDALNEEVEYVDDERAEEIWQRMKDMFTPLPPCPNTVQELLGMMNPKKSTD